MLGQLGNKLFGPDPKLEFTKPGHGLDLLARSTANIPEDSPYWRQYLTLFDSPTDLVLLLPASQLAHALRSNPRNIVSLIRYCVRTLVRHASGAGTGPGGEKEVMNAVRVLARVIPVVLAPRAAGEEDEFELAVFGAQESRVRLEPDEEEDGAAMLGQSSGERPASASASAEEGQFVLADDEDDDQEEEGTTPPPRPDDDSAPNAPPPQPPLAEQLLAALVDLLFVPGLTLPPRSSDDSSAAVVYTIWEYGIASPAPQQQSPVPPPSPPPLPILLARLEILRLLSLLISLPSLLTPPGLFPTIPNRWRDALVSGRVVGAGGGGGGDKKVVLCLLCSVLNTALAEGARIGSLGGGDRQQQPYHPHPHGSGLEGLKERAARLAAETARRTTHAATGAASSAFSAGSSPAGGGTDPTDEPSARLALVEACWQFLDVVLVEHAPAPAVTGNSNATPIANNQFAYYFSRLHRPGDFDLLAKGMVGFLEAGLTTTTMAAGPAASPSLFAPLAGMLSSAASTGPATTTTTSSRWTTETLAVLLRLLETNRKFVPHHLVSDNPALLVRVLVAVVASMVDWAQEGDEAKLGWVRLASIVVQSLTAQVGGGALGHGHAEGKEGLLRALNAPLEPRVVGVALAAVVQRQVAAQGIETESAEAGYGGAAGSDQKAEPKVVTFSEYLVISLHALVLPADPPSPSYRAALSTLYPSLLLSITNLSPLVRELENEAATRLVRVWLAFSAPSWVLMGEGNPRLVFYLLEAFNNVAQYNLDRNPYLFYALAVSLPRFDLLANFTLALGIAEARRLRAARRERLRPIREGAEDGELSSPSSPSSARRASRDGPSEKALGKRRASSVSLGGLSLSDTHAAAAGATTPTLSRSESSASLGGASLSGEAADAAGENRPFVGRNGFTPTEAWVASWREGLPLDALLVLLSEIRHRLVELDPKFPASNPSLDVISSLRKVLASKEVQTILPPKPDSFPRTRKFLASPASNSWLASVIYARLYLSQIDYLRDSLPVQLFAVAHAPKHAPRLGQLGAEMERVSRSAVQVGGRVGGVLSGVFGRFA